MAGPRTLDVGSGPRRAPAAHGAGSGGHGARCRRPGIPLASLPLLALLAAAVAGGAPAPEPAADQGKPMYDSRYPMLFVDKDLVEASPGVSLTVCEAVKHGENPIVRRGGPGAADETHAEFGGSVWYVDGTFRMWYLAHGKAEALWGTGYAESRDGIHWVKPNLGLQNYAGSTANNLVDLGGRGAGGVVLCDPRDPNRARRYKIAVPNFTPRGRWGVWTLAYSADGLHWQVQERQSPMCGSDEDAEGQCLFRLGDTYYLVTQQLSAFVETRPGYEGRAAALFYSEDPDLAVWKKQPQAVWFLPESSGPYQAHLGLAVWARPNLTIGVYGIMHDRAELDDATTDLGLVLSHDGRRWWEPWPLATILRRGPEGAWDSRFVIQGQGFVNVGDKTLIYYSGNDSGNAGLTCDIGLAALRRDGFGYLGLRIGWSYADNQGPREAEFVSAPIQLHDKETERVLLNLDNVGQAADRWVKAEVLDEQRQPVAGYTLAEADAVSTAGIAVPVTWQGNGSLSRVPSSVIRLKVRLHGGRFRQESPRLYALYFRPPQEVEQ